MTKDEFTGLAYNNPRDALLHLWDIAQKTADVCTAMADAVANLTGTLDEVRNAVQATAGEVAALQATVLELATVVNAPKEA